MAIDKGNIQNVICSTSVGEERCICNKLLCVVNGDSIEIKCNKCKRIMIIKTEGIVEVEVN